jgi:hypothetical protein
MDYELGLRSKESDLQLEITTRFAEFRAGKGHLPTRQDIKMDRLIPVSTHLCFLFYEANTVTLVVRVLGPSKETKMFLATD